jgi:hypothetical protein
MTYGKRFGVENMTLESKRPPDSAWKKGLRFVSTLSDDFVGRYVCVDYLFSQWDASCRPEKETSCL